jgi:uncharacterized protein YktA (UPF0223 family)
LLHKILENVYEGKIEKEEFLEMNRDLRAVDIPTKDMTELQVIDTYRAYILWLENLLLYFRQEIEK